MSWYRVYKGTYTVSFDNLEEAKRYVQSHFEIYGIVLGIEEVKEND